MSTHEQQMIPGWDWPPEVSAETLDDLKMADEVTFTAAQVLKLTDVLEEGAWRLSAALVGSPFIEGEELEDSYRALDELSHGVLWLGAMLVEPA